MSDDVLQALSQLLTERKAADPQTSYVAGLHAEGIDRILRKLGEECTETIVAAKNGEQSAIIYETADLWFHSLVMLSHCGLSADDVLTELARRSGRSGLAEKAARQSTGE